MNVKNENYWDNNDFERVLAELENALDMMEPYYSQNGAGKSGYALLAEMREKKMLVSPFTAIIKSYYTCSICGEVFSHGAKNKPLHKDAQHSAAMFHMHSIHGIEGKSRKAYIQMPADKQVEFKNRKEYLDFANKNPHLV